MYRLLAHFGTGHDRPLIKSCRFYRPKTWLAEICFLLCICFLSAISLSETDSTYAKLAQKRLLLLVPRFCDITLYADNYMATMHHDPLLSGTWV